MQMHMHETDASPCDDAFSQHEYEYMFAGAGAPRRVCMLWLSSLNADSTNRNKHKTQTETSAIFRTDIFLRFRMSFLLHAAVHARASVWLRIALHALMFVCAAPLEFYHHRKLFEFF